MTGPCTLRPARLAGVYFVGSIALGGYVRGQSDIDIVAVCGHQVHDETKTALAERLLEATANCPTRGLEFTLYRADVASSPAKDADFEVNVNGGPRMTPDDASAAEYVGPGAARGQIAEFRQ